MFSFAAQSSIALGSPMFLAQNKLRRNKSRCGIMISDNFGLIVEDEVVAQGAMSVLLGGAGRSSAHGQLVHPHR